MSRTRRYRGYEIVRGAYQGTTDDRMDRWYIEDPDATEIRRWKGYATVKEAKNAIDDWHEMKETT